MSLGEGRWKNERTHLSCFHVVLFSLIEDDFDVLMLETKWNWELFNLYLNWRRVFDRTVFSMALLHTKEILTLLC